MLELLAHNEKLQMHWVKRSLALAIDVVLVFLPVNIVMVIIGWTHGLPWYMGAVISGFIWFAYSAIFEFANHGQTVGKMVFGLRVVPLGGRIELYNTMMRNITKVFGGFLILEFVLSLLVESTDGRQRYMDAMAKLTVTEEKGLIS